MRCASRNEQGDWTPLELFLAGVRGLESGTLRLINGIWKGEKLINKFGWQSNSLEFSASLIVLGSIAFSFRQKNSSIAM
jgi:hypothetical protein